MKLFAFILLTVPTIGFGQNSWQELQTNKVKRVTITGWKFKKMEAGNNLVIK
jgi:hypothetical protein